jgi:predicted ATPase with chaperone activity
MTDRPPWGSDAARVRGAAIIGAGGYLVDVDAAISNGPSRLDIHGLPATSTRETRDRIRAAIINSALPWPARSITINLLPARLPKSGTSLDLAVAVAVLAATGTVPQTAAGGCVFAAELGLDGRLRSVVGAPGQQPFSDALRVGHCLVDKRSTNHRSAACASVASGVLQQSDCHASVVEGCRAKICGSLLWSADSRSCRIACVG